MSKPDKIINHEDWCALKEHLQHIRDFGRVYINHDITEEDLKADNEKCLQRLEGCEDVRI